MCRYRVKVRGTIFLWGSQGITVNRLYPMLLMIRVDDFGEPINRRQRLRSIHENVKNLLHTTPISWIFVLLCLGKPI